LDAILRGNVHHYCYKSTKSEHILPSLLTLRISLLGNSLKLKFLCHSASWALALTHSALTSYCSTKWCLWIFH